MQQPLTPQQLVDALSLTCRPRDERGALVLAVQASVLLSLGDKGVEPAAAADGEGEWVSGSESAGGGPRLRFRFFVTHTHTHTAYTHPPPFFFFFRQYSRRR